MLLTVKKSEVVDTEETIEVQAPSWYRHKYLDQYSHITEAGGIVIVNTGLVAFFDKDDYYTNENIIKAVREFNPCAEDEFKAAVTAELERIQNAIGLQHINA